MTVELDLGNDAYLYAQDLDNLGGTEYWRVTASGGKCERMLPADARLDKIRESLDALNSIGRTWRIGGVNLKSRVNFSGDCVITVCPQTRDVSGRVSPVLLLFNALGSSRGQAAAAFAAIPALMGRELGAEDPEIEARLKRVLSWPRLIILLHIAIFSRGDFDV